MADPEIDLLSIEKGAITAPAGCGKPLEDKRRTQHQDEGADDAGHQSKGQENRHRRRQTHRRETDRVHRQRAEQPGAARARQAHRGKQRAREIADEIRRGDQAGLRFGKRKRLDHRRQNRRVDKAADTHAGGHRQQAADRNQHRSFVAGAHAANATRADGPCIMPIGDDRIASRDDAAIHTYLRSRLPGSRSYGARQPGIAATRASQACTAGWLVARS